MNSTESDRYQPKSLPHGQSILDLRFEILDFGVSANVGGFEIDSTDKSRT